MAENVAITPGTGDVVGADDITGVKYQRVKLIHGADGTNDGDVSTINGLPIQGTVTANLSATDNAVLDDIALDTEAVKTSLETAGGQLVNLGANNDVTLATLPDTATGDLAAIESNTDGIEGSLSSIDGKITACNTGAVAGTVTANLSATDNAVLDDIAANQTDASQKAQIVDGSGNVIGATSNALDVNIKSGGAGDGTILDGVSSAIKATVLDYTSSNPLAVRLTDTGGDYVAAGAGTQYTEDAPSAADPVGSALNLIRADSPSAITTTDGDNVSARGTNKGEMYVKHIDAIPVTDNGGALTVDGTVAVTNAGITTIAGAVAGTEMQVDVLTMPTVTVNSHAVTATDLDIRNLTNVDVVTAELSAVDNAVLDTIAAKDFATQTTLSAMNAKMVSGTDIGDVTINNSTGAAAVNIQDGGNSITVDGSLTVDLGANNDVTVTNATAANLKAEVTNAGTFATQATLQTGSAAIGKLAANSGVDIGDVDVTSLPALTAGTNAIGKLLPPNIDVTAHTYYARKYYTSAGAATDGIIWSPAAGTRWHVVTMYIQVSAAATVTLEDDQSGGDDPVWKGELAANSGVVLSFTENYPMASGEDAADLTITTSAGNVYVTCVGYEI
jgi:hypothetical protein